MHGHNLFALSRSVRSEFFHGNLSKCSVGPDAQNCPNKRKTNFMQLEIHHKQRRFSRKNSVFSDGKLANWQLYDACCSRVQ